MENNIIKDEIIELLEIIIEQSEVISVREGQIPQIEIDIVLSNIRELYDKYRALDKSNQQMPYLQVQNDKPKPTIVENNLNKEKSEIKKPVVEEKKIIKEEKVIPKENISQIPLPLDEKIPEKNTEPPQEKIQRPSVDLFSSHSTIADNFKDEKRSLNEKLSLSQTDKSIADKLKKNPIKDLKVSIGINEKFKFINELFEGNLQKYDDGLAKLNSFSNYEEAYKYLLFLKKESGWGDENEAYLLLSELVSRRYL